MRAVRQFPTARNCPPTTRSGTESEPIDPAIQKRRSEIGSQFRNCSGTGSDCAVPVFPVFKTGNGDTAFREPEIRRHLSAWDGDEFRREVRCCWRHASRMVQATRTTEWCGAGDRSRSQSPVDTSLWVGVDRTCRCSVLDRPTAIFFLPGSLKATQGGPAVVTIRTCPECGSTFSPARNGRRGRQRRFCCHECTVSWHRRQERPTRAKSAQVERRCKSCGVLVGKGRSFCGSCRVERIRVSQRECDRRRRAPNQMRSKKGI